LIGHEFGEFVVNLGDANLVENDFTLSVCDRQENATVHKARFLRSVGNFRL
jgi:hypothetical protein